MRKFRLAIIVLLTMMLTGCQWIMDTAFDLTAPMSHDEAHADFQSFLNDDIIVLNDYIDVVNQMTFGVIPSIVQITLEIRSIPQLDLIEKRVGAGIMLYETSDRTYILTSIVFDTKDNDFNNTLQVINYKGDLRSAKIVYYDVEVGLAIIEIMSFTQTGFANLSQRYAKINEPVILIGHQQGIRFAMTMGLYASQDHKVFESTIDPLWFDIGGIFFNLNGQVIGIVTTYDQEQTVWRIASIDTIETFIEGFLIQDEQSS